MNVAICIPARDEVHTGFAHDLARLSAHWYSQAPPSSTFKICFNAGTLIADQRHKLAQQSVNAGTDYTLFLDSDMRFPPYLLEKLIARNLDIVACNYPTRRVPVKTVAFSDFTKLECIYSHDKSGTQEVDAIGMGAMLVRTDVFKRLPLPWFNVSWLPTVKAYVGEDIYFCKLAQAHGFKVWVDHDLSKEVRHIGSMEFTHDHAEASQPPPDDVATAAAEIAKVMP